MSLIEAVTIPKWGMTMTEGKITQWIVPEGSLIERGQEILEIETTKVTNVLEAAAGGKLRRIVLEEGTTAPVGALAGVIADDDATAEEIDAFVASYADRLQAAEDGDGAVTAKLIAVAGGNVNLLEAGQGDKTVVFIHGFGGDLSTWLFNQTPLSETMHTIAIDVPGHGDSSPATGDIVLPKIVSSIEAALDNVTEAKLHLVAHSFGGAVATELAARRPDRVGSLTLIAPIGVSKNISRDFLTDFVAAERRRPLQAVLERLFADPSKITNDMVEGTLRFKRLEGVPEALTKIADEIAGEQGQLQAIGGKLAGLACPVLLIWGDQDQIVPPPSADELPSNVELKILPEVGHMPQMEASTLVNDEIARNISRKA
jgi:pyruvate dehydrogenase E2 component (dihydrolipoamide acetyltransferase)